MDDVYALVQLASIIRERLYDPRNYLERKPDELLIDWQTRTLMQMMRAKLHKRADGTEVLVVVIEN